MLRVGEHKVEFITARVIEGRYVLYSNKDASEAWVEVYDPDLSKITEAKGTTHAIPENTTPAERDWNKTVRAWAGFNKVGIWRFVFWARDDFPDADKAHRRKLAHTANQNQIDWILSGGFDYGPGDLNTTGVARAIERHAEQVGYVSQGRMRDTPIGTVQQIAELSCNKFETKNSKGLISFVGHGGNAERRVLLYTHQPATDNIMFPRPDIRDDKRIKWLGANPLESWECPRKYPLCPGIEYDIGNIKEHITDEERKQNLQPLSNVLVFTLNGCLTNTDIGGDFAKKLNELGVKAVLGYKVLLGGTRGEGLSLWDMLFSEIWKHLSHGATLQSATKIAFDKFISEAKRIWVRLGVYFFNRPCNSASLRRFVEYEKGKPYFPLGMDDIIKITGDGSIRIIDPNDSRAKSKRRQDRCEICVK